MGVVREFMNFMSWQLEPGTKDKPMMRPACPPAVIAYMWGLTKYCPKEGEL